MAAGEGTSPGSGAATPRTPAMSAREPSMERTWRCTSGGAWRAPPPHPGADPARATSSMMVRCTTSGPVTKSKKDWEGGLLAGAVAVASPLPPRARRVVVAVGACAATPPPLPSSSRPVSPRSK